MNSTHKLRVIKFMACPLKGPLNVMACPSTEVCGIGVKEGRLEFTPPINKVQNNE
jgi:hypothetical protein